MKIMVMRHAESLPRQQARVRYDAERPLSGRGRGHAERLGRWLAQWGCAPDPVLTSPFIRTQETAALVCAQLRRPVQPVPLVMLAPGSGKEELLRAAVNYGNPALSWSLAVMHEPDVSYILGSLLYDGKTYPLSVREGDLFALDVSFSQGRGSGKLLFYLSPAFLEDAPHEPA